MSEEWQSSDNQSVEHAMLYLQDVEKELPEKEFAEFLLIIEEFKINRWNLRKLSLPCSVSPVSAVELAMKNFAVPAI